MKGFQIFFFSFSRGHSGERRQEGKERGGDDANANVYLSASADLVRTLVHRNGGKKRGKHTGEKRPTNKQTNKTKTIDSRLCVRLHQITNQRLPQGKVGILTLCGLAGSLQQKPDWDFHVLELKALREHSHGPLCMYVRF